MTFYSVTGSWLYSPFYHLLRAILQESEAKLEMKIFDPPSIFVWG